MPRTVPTFSLALARTPTGLLATLTVANPGSADIDDLRLLRADILSQVGGKTLPLKIGKLRSGTSTTVTLPYSGPAPAAKAPVQINLQFEYKTGLFTSGGCSTSLTSTLP
jgi:hypothetical protein